MRRSVKALAVAAAAVVLFPFLTVTAAQAATTFSTTLVNQAANRCAAVPGGASTAALQLTQQTCNSATYQGFTFTPVAGTTDQYSVNTVTAGSCLDIFGASTADN